MRYSVSCVSAFLTPLFGIATGHMVLGEPIGVTFIAAIALVLVNRRR